MAAKIPLLPLFLVRKYYFYKMKSILYIFILLSLNGLSQVRKPSKMIDSLKKEYFNVSLKNFDQSIRIANQGLSLASKEKDSVSYAAFERLLGVSYYFKGDYKTASQHYFKSIKTLENNKDKAELGHSYNELAKLYRKTRKLTLATENYDKALAIFVELNDSSNISMIYNESGVVFEYEGNYKEALKRYNLSLHISENLKDNVAEAYALNNVAGVYSILNKYNDAQVYLLRALAIRKVLKDSFAIAINFSDLASNNILEHDFNNGLKYIDSSNTIAIKLTYLELRSQNYLLLTKAYENNHDIVHAYKAYQAYISLKDSIFNRESESQLNELNTKYQTEKKDLELAKNKIEIVNERNKRYITYGALAFFIIVCSISIWAFIQKRKNSRLLQSKNQLLESANKQISHQKEELSEKQKEIVDSINYARKIQNALLASEKMLIEHLLNYFILFKPKDIVSGDFTWATIKDNHFYIACCDSTGHGVPGAFMSLLNIGFLSEAIKERNILEPGKIFDYVRSRLIETIGNDDQKDGFDGILICLDTHTKKMTYAAANNSPLIIRNNELVYLPCNKMPVGEGIKKELFDTFSLNYQKDDLLYLFTDGYPDQFGGPKGKKFKYKQLE
jgi:serine phosphatase RsbU (regulator of sigma subunit)